MNIAIFASAYHPSLGGVEELCRQLALELIHQGHHVIVLTNRWPRDLPARETIDGIPIYRLPFRLPEGSAKAAINYHLSHYLITQRMLLILHENKIDMLHVQCVSSNAHYALIAQDRLKLPLVVTLQGELTMDANQIFQKSPQAQNILRRALDKAQIVTACSAKTLRDGEEFYGKALGEKGRVVFNGVNLRAYSPSTNDDLATEHTEITEDATNNPQIDTEAADALNSIGGSCRTGISPPGSMRRPDGLNEAASLEALKNKDTFKPLSDAPHRVSLSDAQPSVSLSEATPSVSLKPPQAAVSLSGRDRAPRRYIFALGRMAREKGFDILLRAYAALRPTANGLATDEKGSKAPQNTLIIEPRGEISRPMASGQEPPIGIGHCSLLIERPHSSQIPSLIIAGAGPELEPLKRLAAELGLTDRVQFPGRADRQQVAAYMLGCEFFVLSSRADEGLPVVCAEAMGAGCAIVATRSGGAPEAVLDGQTGLLVDKENVQQLATAMQQLIDNPDLRHRLAAAGKARAAQFAWPKITGQYLAAYAATEHSTSKE